MNRWGCGSQIGVKGTALTDSVLSDGVLVCCVHAGKSGGAVLEISIISKCCYCKIFLESHGFYLIHIWHKLQTKYMIQPKVSIEFTGITSGERMTQEAASTKSPRSMNSDSPKLHRWYTMQPEDKPVNKEPLFLCSCYCLCNPGLRPLLILSVSRGFFSMVNFICILSLRTLLSLLKRWV